jgi:hypothetical protein
MYEIENNELKKNIDKLNKENKFPNKNYEDEIF